MKSLFYIFAFLTLALACSSKDKNKSPEMQQKVDEFAAFTLTSDISDLDSNQKEMLKLLFQVSDIMNELFWEQTFGSREKALALGKDSVTKKFIEINYGPWERLNGNISFIAGVGEKPLGANFYPTDMSKEEFDSMEAPDKTSLYTLVRRDDKGKLVTIPYHIAYKEKIDKAAGLILKAALLSGDKEFKKYLELRAQALLTSNYLASDLAWMDMKSNRIDFVVGPIENYEDQLYGYKASFEAYILLKDLKWSEQLDRFAVLLPELQKRLPVEDKYKKEVPGSNSDLGAYDVLYYSGDCNAGSKTIAINLPNDPEVHKQKGSRRLQLKNAMQAKFDKIMLPITQELIDPAQIEYVNFNSFFENVMFHEGAHGIGVHHVVGDTATVQNALLDLASAFEEGKADILGLFLVNELIQMGEIKSDIKKNYVTFAAGIFRSIRFGASSAHGKANLVCYNYFKEKGAFTRSPAGIYTIDFEKMNQAVSGLSREILTIQGDGNYQAASEFAKKYSVIPDELKQDLERINNKNIPKDIIFNQGPEYLGL